MICKKCGATIEETSKFCIYCGSKIEEIGNPINPVENNLQNNIVGSSIENQNINERVQVTSNPVHEPVINQSVNQVTQANVSAVNVSQPVQNDVNNQLEQTVVVPTNQVMQQMPTPSSNKKGNKTLIFIILGVVLAIIAGVLLFFAFNKSSSNSIEVLKKAINNFEDKGDNSGTINLSLIMESDASAAINLSAAIKYAKVNNDYNIAFTLNKSLLFDEINLYSTVTDKDVTLYAKSSLVDMLGMTSSNTDMWLHYLLSLDDLDIEEATDKVEDNLDLSKVLDDNHYKFIEEKEGLRHYQLTIDTELLEKIEKITESSETLKGSIDQITDEEMKLDQPIDMDFYINKSNELVKISIDMSKFVDDQTFSKVAFEIGFADFGNTKVEIPDDAKKSTMDFETYMSTYTSSMGFDTGFDTDLNTNFDTNIDTNFDTNIDTNFDTNFDFSF